MQQCRLSAKVQLAHSVADTPAFSNGQRESSLLWHSSSSTSRKEHTDRKASLLIVLYFLCAAATCNIFHSLFACRNPGCQQAAPTVRDTLEGRFPCYSRCKSQKYQPLNCNFLQYLLHLQSLAAKQAAPTGRNTLKGRCLCYSRCNSQRTQQLTCNLFKISLCSYKPGLPNKQHQQEGTH
jgi:hypothetical protein